MDTDNSPELLQSIKDLAEKFEELSEHYRYLQEESKCLLDKIDEQQVALVAKEKEIGALKFSNDALKLAGVFANPSDSTDQEAKEKIDELLEGVLRCIALIES